MTILETSRPSSTSTSFPDTGIITATSSFVTAESPIATGGSFTLMTVTTTSAESDAPPSSNTSYMKLSEPKKSPSGIYQISPVELFTLVEPSEGPLITVTLPGTNVPSSTSFKSTRIQTPESSFVIPVSSNATGGSLTSVTITETNAVLEVTPDKSSIV